MGSSLLKKSESGQAVLLVLLGMAAVLTLVLSVVSRSVSDISVTSRDEASSQAYSAAEEGIEALLLNPSISQYSTSGVDASAEKYAKDKTTADYDPIKAGQSDTIWFVSHRDNGNLVCDPSGDLPCLWGSSGNNTKEIEICWGNPETSDADAPAIEVSYYLDSTSGALGNVPDYSGVKVIRKLYTKKQIGNTTPNSVGCSWPGYEFSTGSQNIMNMLNITDPAERILPGYLLFARVKMLFNSSVEHGVGVSVTAATLPQQGWKIVSTGTSADATRRVETIQYYPDPLDIFDNAISSFGSDGGSLTK